MTARLRVGITRDILDAHGEPAFGRKPLALLDVPNARLGVSAGGRATPGARSRRALRRGLRERGARSGKRHFAWRLPAEGRCAAWRRLRLRRRAGHDRAGIVVTNTPSSMPRPVATIALTFILALAGKLMLKDRLTAAAAGTKRMENMGRGLTGRTLGVIGTGASARSCCGWRARSS
jgi:hypothetical protein